MMVKYAHCNYKLDNSLNVLNEQVENSSNKHNMFEYE